MGAAVRAVHVVIVVHIVVFVPHELSPIYSSILARRTAVVSSYYG